MKRPSIKEAGYSQEHLLADYMNYADWQDKQIKELEEANKNLQDNTVSLIAYEKLEQQIKELKEELRMMEYDTDGEISVLEQQIKELKFNLAELEKTNYIHAGFITDKNNKIKELKELIKRAINMHPVGDDETKDDWIEGGYELLKDFKQALKI